MMIVLVGLAANGCGGRDGAKRDDTRGGAADSVQSPASAPDSMTAGMTTETPPFLSPEELAGVPEPSLSRDALAALAPPHLRIQDLGFQLPTALPDTTGLKNKAKLQREWSEAIISYHKMDYAGTSTHLAKAREFLQASKGADLNWPARLRNLEAATIYATKPPGEVKRRFGEIASPSSQEVLDTAFEWILLHDDLRLGRGRDAVARLRIIQASPLSINLEARKLMARLLPSPSGSPSNAPPPGS
jgi:hypothetical protein